MRESVVLPHLPPSEIPETVVNEATPVLEWLLFSTTSTDHFLVLLLLILSYNRKKHTYYPFKLECFYSSES